MQINPLALLVFLVIYFIFLLFPTGLPNKAGFQNMREGLSLPILIGTIGGIALISSFIISLFFIKDPLFSQPNFVLVWTHNLIVALLGLIGFLIILLSFVIFSFFWVFLLLFGYEHFKRKYLETSDHLRKANKYPILGEIERILRECQKRAKLEIPTKFIILDRKERDRRGFSGCAITGKKHKEMAILVGEDFLSSFDKGILNEKEVRAMLSHEIAHILHKDHLLPLLGIELENNRLMPLLTWIPWVGCALFAIPVQRFAHISIIFYIIPIAIFLFFLRYLGLLVIARSMWDREYIADQEAMLRFRVPKEDLSSAIKKMALLESSKVNSSSLGFFHRKGKYIPKKGEKGVNNSSSLFPKVGAFLKKVFINQVSYHPPLKKRLEMLSFGVNAEKNEQKLSLIVKSAKEEIKDILWLVSINTVIAFGYVTISAFRNSIEIDFEENFIFSLFWLLATICPLGDVYEIRFLNPQAIRSRFLRNWLAILIGHEWRRIHLKVFIMVFITSCFVAVLELGSFGQTLLTFFLCATMTSISFVLLVYAFDRTKEFSKKRRNDE